MVTYLYQNKPMLIDRFCIYKRELDYPFLQQDTPILPLIDDTEYSKTDIINADRSVSFEVWENEKGEVLYTADRMGHEMFAVGLLAPQLHSCVAYCQVETEQPANVLIRLVCSCKSKVFLNGTLLAMNDQALDQFVKCKLKQGINTFVIECYHIIPAAEISIRINDLAEEEKCSLTALDYTNCSTYNRFLTSMYEYDQNCVEITYYAYLDDQVNDYESFTFVGSVLDHDFQYIGEFTPRLRRKEQIKLSDYHLKDMEIPIILLRFTVYDGETRYYETQRPFIIGDLTQINNKVIEKAEGLIQKGDISSYDRYVLRQCLQRTYNIGSSPNVIWSQTSFIRSFLMSMDKGMNMNEIYQLPRNHYIHFFNPLDNRDDMYSVVTPSDYSNSKKYALIININNANGDNQFIYYNYNLDKKTIFADLFLKGVTLGSYIGEASFFIYLKDIMKRFSIDEERIYLTGGCNGAYAAYALAQNHPHLFAAISCISGNMYLPALMNLYNLPVYNVYSESESYYNADTVKEVDQLPLATDVHMEACSHRIIMSSMQRSFVIDTLLRIKRNKYPKHLRFYTERNYHRKCYWIELLGISFGEYYADMEAHASSSSIIITLRNCDGVHIQIPPYVDKTEFYVNVNGKIFTFSQYKKKDIIIALSGEEYRLVDEKPLVPNLKGLGILSVYMRPVRIVCDKTNAAQMKVAGVFSNPCTMGFKSEILVKYPIFAYSYLKRTKQNIILIRRYDALTEYNMLTQIHCEKDGYMYKGELHEGRYVVLEAVEVRPRSFSLVITYNDEELLSKMLFVRKMIIPTYYNGSRALACFQAMIFDGSRYYSIYEPGADVTEVSGIRK